MNRLKWNRRRKPLPIGIKCLGLLIVLGVWAIIAIVFWSTIDPPKPNQNAAKFLGKYGTAMVEMLPDDLPFTAFVPSERAFKRELRLSPNNNANLSDDAIAVVSRVLGFSSVPRALFSSDVALYRSSSFDSISGFELRVSKDRRGNLVVNGVRSRRVDLRAKQIVIHIMDGVIMDSQFRDSF